VFKPSEARWNLNKVSVVSTVEEYRALSAAGFAMYAKRLRLMLAFVMLVSP
jgi:hypothetical protein